MNSVGIHKIVMALPLLSMNSRKQAGYFFLCIFMDNIIIASCAAFDNVIAVKATEWDHLIIFFFFSKYCVYWAAGGSTCCTLMLIQNGICHLKIDLALDECFSFILLESRKHLTKFGAFNSLWGVVLWNWCSPWFILEVWHLLKGKMAVISHLKNTQIHLSPPTAFIQSFIRTSLCLSFTVCVRFHPSVQSAEWEHGWNLWEPHGFSNIPDFPPQHIWSRFSSYGNVISAF